MSWQHGSVPLSTKLSYGIPSQGLLHQLQSCLAWEDVVQETYNNQVHLTKGHIGGKLQVVLLKWNYIMIDMKDFTLFSTPLTTSVGRVSAIPSSLLRWRGQRIPHWQSCW